MSRFTDAEVAELNRIGQFFRTPLSLGEKLQSGLLMKEGTPVNAVNATKTLTLTGVAKDTETVTIGDDVYEFAADTVKSVEAGNIAVDINAVTGKATVTLTIDTQPTEDDTMTIGTKVYTFVADGDESNDGDISVGTSLATAKTNIVAAINGTDTINDPHPLVTAGDFVVNNLAITAIIGGTNGNAIASVETFFTGTNVFNHATLTAGTDCTATNAVTALVAEITAHGTEPVTATDGAGDTVVVTADVAGDLGNDIGVSETMTNASFGGTNLAGGIDATEGDDGDMMADNTYLYICIAVNTIADKNWRRLALGSTF